VEEPSEGVDALQPGDTLRVLPGEYRLGAAVIVKNKRAAAAAPITIEARGKVVLRDGANKVDPWQGALDVRDSSWIVIRGFSIEQSGFFVSTSTARIISRWSAAP